VVLKEAGLTKLASPLVGFDKFDIDLGLNGAIAQVHPLLSY
jgi:hypothetical protein